MRAAAGMLPAYTLVRDAQIGRSAVCGVVVGGRVSATAGAGWRLRANLPAETSAYMFFASLMIFFVVHRLLPADERQQRAGTFVDEMA